MKFFVIDCGQECLILLQLFTYRDICAFIVWKTTHIGQIASLQDFVSGAKSAVI